MTRRTSQIAPRLVLRDRTGRAGLTRRDLLKAGVAGVAAVAFGELGLGPKPAGAQVATPAASPATPGGPTGDGVLAGTGARSTTPPAYADAAA